MARRKFDVCYKDNNNIHRTIIMTADNPRQAEEYFTMFYFDCTLMDIEEHDNNVDAFETEVPAGWEAKDEL